MQQRVSAATSRHPVWLLAGFWFCVVIAIGVVLRRLVELIRPSQARLPQMASLNAAFSSHSVLTAMHIIPAAIFVLVSAALLLRRDGGEWLERLFFLFGAVTGATAYAMSYYAIGGRVERSAVLVFNTWFLFSLGRAWWFRRRCEQARKREWMTRAVGILLGIATTRPVMGVFFATSSRTHLVPRQFFGIAFWTGFSINAGVIELWLHSKRRAQLHQPDRSQLSDFAMTLPASGHLVKSWRSRSNR